MALSKLTPERMIRSMIESIRKDWNAKTILPPIIHCDCQDTEMNNETECYFYFNGHLSKREIHGVGKALCLTMCVPSNCYSLEYNDDSDEWRVEIICELTINGKKLIKEN